MSEHTSTIDEQHRSDAAALAQMKKTIAMVAHDLKSPLTGVKLYADILLSGVAERDAESCAKYLAIISSEAERMSRMINNIVDYQNIITAQIEWHDEVADIVTIVEASVKPVRQWCLAKGISFSFESNVERLMIPVDADRFARLLFGFLTNAMRFTESGGVKLVLRKTDEKLALAVVDSGPGISEERLQPLFKPQDGVKSLGKDIGLAFAGAVVDHYQGRIWAESVVGSGSVFHIELPLPHETVEM